MLVLSRKHGERIMVGEEIVITVVKIGPHAVRIGVEAPAEFRILREELAGSETMSEGEYDADCE